MIDLQRPAKANLFALAPTEPYGNRLVVDLEDSQAEAKNQVVTAPKQVKRDIIVAIDAGHGGDDPGSIGPSGMFEKRSLCR